MPILTRPGSFTKGTNASLTLNKTLLAAVTIVANDSYFSNTANWQYVKLVYSSSVGNQDQSVKFDCSQGSPTASFYTTSRARDIFNIQSIIIVDFDNGYFIVPTSSLNVSEFQLDYQEAGPTYITWSNFFNAVGMTVGANGGITPTGSAFAWGTAAYRATSINSNVDFTLTYVMNQSGSNEVMFGFSRSVPAENGLITDGFYPRGQTAVNIRDNGNTTTQTVSMAFNTNHTLVIQRTGSTISYKVNGVEVQTATYSGVAYAHLSLGSQNAVLVSAALA